MQLDDQILRPCPPDVVVLKNLTVNGQHDFLLNVTTSSGERNSSSYSWFIGKYTCPQCIFFPLGDQFTISGTGFI